MSSRLSLKLSSLLLLGAVGLTTNLPAEENPWEWGPQATGKATIAPKRLVDLYRIAPAHTLSAANEESVRVITDWNLAGNLPLRNGIERPLPESMLVVLPTEFYGAEPKSLAGGVLTYSANDDAMNWGLAIRADDAWRLRLRLSALHLPVGTRMWVFGEGEETVGPFGTELMGPDGTLWTPSVAGPEIRLEVSMPTTVLWESEDPPTIEIVAISEIFPLDERGMPKSGREPQLNDTSCLVDAACVPTSDYPLIDTVKRAIAYLEFQVGGIGYKCTGALVNDRDQQTWVPYLLTANHCFATQNSASSLEAFFDYSASTCNGSPPSLASLPRSSGATLLKTSSANDFTFVRLNQSPGGRSFLGWTTAEPANNETLYRVSHPFGWSAFVSAGSKASNPSLIYCSSSTANYHFTQTLLGGTFGGSSGAPLLNASGQIVGQLLGGCGPNSSDGCDYSNYEIDGKFSVSFPQISQYINMEGGGGGGGTGSCTNNLTNGVVCLRNGRFEFTGTWTDFANPATTRPLIWTPVEDINATGGFQNNPSGIQVVMRVADGCSQTGAYWVWLGGFTDAGWSINVRDTVTGRQKTFNRTRQSGAFPATLRDATTFTCN